MRTFRTVTQDLLALRAWLQQEGCTHVAMESTGVYWQPVYAILEGACELVVGNARHIKNVPGRKTDVKDSEWIADLARHGRIAKRFVPPKPMRVRRALVRYRRTLVESCSTERNRLLKLLETCTIKLASVASHVFGVSGMAMLRALAANVATPTDMAQLVRGTLRTTIPALVLARDGRLDAEHRFLLHRQLDRLDQMREHRAALDRQIDQPLLPLRDAPTRRKTVPGIDRIIAFRILAESGVDLSAFASAEALASWAGVCSGNHETAGKRRRGTTRPGNVHLTTALVEAAHAAIRTKGSYLREKFHRLRVRRGYNRALIAIAHKILIAVYHMLRTGTYFQDLGADYLDRTATRSATRRLVHRLEKLGDDVQLTRKAA